MLSFGFRIFCWYRGFCHRTGSDLLLFLLACIVAGLSHYPIKLFRQHVWLHISTLYIKVEVSFYISNDVSNFKPVSLCFYTPVFRRDVLWYGDVRPSVRPSGSPSVRHSFPHFSPTCFDIFFWNFVYHFIFMHVRSSSNAINYCHFLQELCSFLTSNYNKYAVFRTFLLHALTYWVQILYMTLF